MDMEIEFSIVEIEHVAQEILKQNPEKTILFYGEMGAGKTTLIKAIGKILGVSTCMSSPTFSLVNEYKTTSDEIIYHFDFYRIKSENEALDMGFEEYIYSGNYCFIEWAEKIPSLIPQKHSVISISLQANEKRKIIFEK